MKINGFFRLHGHEVTKNIMRAYLLAVFFHRSLLQLKGTGIEHSPNENYLRGMSELEHYLSTLPFPKQGRMFGFLLGVDGNGLTHELWAYSGSHAGGLDSSKFVGPASDVRAKSPEFVAGEQRVGELSSAIDRMQVQPEFLELNDRLTAIREAKKKEIDALKEVHSIRRQHRTMQRTEGNDAIALNRESQLDKIQMRALKALWDRREEEAVAEFEAFNQQIQDLIQERSMLSASLHRLWFEQFTVPNAAGEEASVSELFAADGAGFPPAGTGECVAPKLFAEAARRKLSAVHFEEFWWGPPPRSEVRRHRQRYAPCRGRCQPLLKHMLTDTALVLPDDPSLVVCHADIEVLHAGQGYVVIHKPAGLLSIPGKLQSDSVQTRIAALYPEARGPMIVHRLDQATSGLMLVALDERSYHELQRQFLERKVEKRYLALLEGVPETDNGEIELPLRVDPMDRPRQVVDFKYGKEARTRWKLHALSDGRAWVHFWPETGRTHQLRVHAAHVDGLNRPIVGDPLYGNAGERLMLFAEILNFNEPYSGKPQFVKLPQRYVPIP